MAPNAGRTDTVVAQEMPSGLADWVGRTEVRGDVISPAAADRLAATLDRDDPPVSDGDRLPPLLHFLAFQPAERQSLLGEDGHPERGGFLPPVHHLPRRMWAGSRLTFPGELRAGQQLVRRSTIKSIKEREGRQGPLVFVTVGHEIAAADGTVLVTDEHDIVYRGAGGAAPAGEAAPEGEWTRTVTPDPVMLFRYSALTFNGHRIHYDLAYVRDVEGYRGLVVHGPLIATLLMDLLRRHRPHARVASFSFRAQAPSFADEPLGLNAAPRGNGVVDLWTRNGDGAVGMRAEARIEE